MLYPLNIFFKKEGRTHIKFLGHLIERVHQDLVNKNISYSTELQYGHNNKEAAISFDCGDNPNTFATNGHLKELLDYILEKGKTNHKSHFEVIQHIGNLGVKGYTLKVVSVTEKKRFNDFLIRFNPDGNLPSDEVSKVEELVQRVIPSAWAIALEHVN